MRYRNLLLAAVLAGPRRGRTIRSTTALPSKNPRSHAGSRHTMDQVATKFGAPVNKVPAVGKAAISRWDIRLVVYFEANHVIPGGRELLKQIGKIAGSWLVLRDLFAAGVYFLR